MTKTNNDSQNFDPEILEIENELVDYFVKSMMKYSGRDLFLSKCMVYFFTRKQLTQKELQRLTGFSAGTISKTVRRLIDLKLVEKEYIEGTHKLIYTMEELPYAKPSYLLNIEGLLGGISVKLENMKLKLDEIMEFKDDIPGFNKAYSIITQISGVINSVPQFVDIFKKELEEYLKKYPQFEK